MLKEVYISRLVQGAFGFLVLLVISSTVYFYVSTATNAKLDAFRANLHKRVESGQISKQESIALLKHQRATLETEGLSAWEAAQSLDARASGPDTYVKELADIALAENPNDPERLFFWAMRQPYVEEGPSPEREAAYEKLFAMEGIAPERSAVMLDCFAGTIWCYRPLEALRYRQEAAALSDESNYDLMGHTYQRLGMYDKALEVYSDYQAQTNSHVYNYYIQLIEAGTPPIPPIERPVEETPLASDKPFAR